MIPEFNASGVLPPFLGSCTSQEMTSPYVIKMSDLVAKFATSAARIALLEGLLQYRAALALVGVVDGHQWIAGSFLENVEQTRKRAPQDIDLVTFATLPVEAEDKVSFVKENSHIFSPVKAKKQFGCDAKFVDLGLNQKLIVKQTQFYSGLYSHTHTRLWKGMLEIPLDSDDSQAFGKLKEIKEAKND